MNCVSYNGKLMTEPMVPVDQGYLYGYGLFETLKVQNEKMIYFDDHMERLSQSSSKIGLDFPIERSQVRNYCNDVLSHNELRDGCLRIAYGKGSEKNDLLITSRENPYTQEMYAEGFKVMTSGNKRNEDSLLVSIKSNNYLENLLILQQAKDMGYQEAILYNTKGFLAEGTMSNVFFIKNDRIYTPASNNGLLSGIIRGKVIYLAEKIGVPLEEGYYRKEEFMDADEIFITNSLMEMMPVSLLDHKEFKHHTVTNDLIENYSRTIKNGGTLENG